MTTINKTNIKNEGLNKCRFAFEWHNGLMLQSKLNRLTNDIYGLHLNPSNYKFTNAKKECVKIDFNGKVISSSVNLPSQFTNSVEKKIGRTNEMFSKLNIN